jgi:hypothetical protein
MIEDYVLRRWPSGGWLFDERSLGLIALVVEEDELGFDPMKSLKKM